MSKNKHTKIKKRSQDLVNRIYAGALNPAEYNDIFAVWDKHFQDIENLDQANEISDFDWADEFVRHFERAGEVMDQIQLQQSETIENHIEKLPYPALACDLSGKIIHANRHTQILTQKMPLLSLYDLSLSIKSRARLLKLMQRAQIGSQTTDIIRVYADEASAPHIFICESVAENRFEVSGNTAFKGLVIKSISAVWNDEIEQALKDVFDLTQAEVDLVGNLYKGLSIKEIAEWTKRSQATLRTQLSSILKKTDTKSQSSLSRIVASLVHMIGNKNRHLEAETSPRLQVNNRKQIRKTIELSNGLTLEYIESGALEGKPFFFIQTSSEPTLTKKIVDGLFKSGIRLISPVRPGNGRTTKTPLSFTPKDWARFYLEIIDNLGIKDFVCGGHCSGGIYALELACLAKARCKSVLLVDTGAPLQNAKHIYAMPSAPRRLFVAARFFPKAIVTPMKYMAADFTSSAAGETRAVEYFYEGSPIDQQIMAEPKNWKITRDNMAYSLKNVPQLAHDVALWAKNNAPVFTKALETSHLRFFHGQKNLMMKESYISKFCAAHTNISAKIVPQRGQLLLYVESDLFVEEIAALCKTLSDTGEQA